MAKMLLEAGWPVTVFDNLSRGFRDAVLCDDFVRGDLRDKGDLKDLFRGRKFEVVVHFAALAYVGESVTDPRGYYENNVVGTANLLNAMLDTGVKKIVFSSTCATYGVPDKIPIVETASQNPINPYGRTKLVIEQMLSDYAQAYGVSSVSLRYFNAAGCDPKGVVGERHDPETHIIPLVLREAKRVKDGGEPEKSALCVFGNDFETPDGTCIRDYIHVSDLCSAHFSAIRILSDRKDPVAEVFNLGNGAGFSVQEVIESCRRVTGVDIQYEIVGRRKGDPPILVGSADKAKEELGWQPRITDIDEIVATAWNWMNL
jgi:UDP-glucose-4-epimerase GalE